MKTKYIVIIILQIIIILNFMFPIVVDANQNNVKPSVKYSSHIQDLGWEKDFSKKDGEQSGTTAKNKKLEAMKIKLEGLGETAEIRYSVYVEGQGWQNEVSNGAVAGTTGQNLKMLGIKINLINVAKYSIKYRIHIQDFGWQDWVYEGEEAGTIQEQKKIEAIEIKLIDKKPFGVYYNSHIQDFGWEEEFSKLNGEESGTTGKNKKIEAIKIRLFGNDSNTGIRYRTYVDNEGWQEWKHNGELSGTTGKNTKLFGIKIELINLDSYSIQYRVHIQDHGWQEWVIDGQTAGKIDEEKKIEAIEIRIVDKTTNIQERITYMSYIQGRGWEEEYLNQNGEMTGTTGKNLKMLGIKIKLEDYAKDAHVEYRIHVQDYGWLEWVSDGTATEKIAEDKKIEAIEIRLKNMDNYTVEYRSHIQDYGWQDWKIDGEQSGTTGKNKKLEALQIRIVPKCKRYDKGIDVSRWQGQIDYDKVVATGEIDFIIPRIGWYSKNQSKFIEDIQFSRNYKQTQNRGIPIGGYVYSYATTVEEAKQEAIETVNYLKNTGQTNFDLPIFFDIEDDTQISLGKQKTAEMAIAFGEIIKQAGFTPGVYSYSYFLFTYMDLNMIPSDYEIWVADFGKSNEGQLPDDIFKYSEYDMWQYSDKGTINGIEGYVDLNIRY